MKNEKVVVLLGNGKELTSKQNGETVSDYFTDVYWEGGTFPDPQEKFFWDGAVWMVTNLVIDTRYDEVLIFVAQLGGNSGPILQSILDERTKS